MLAIRSRAELACVYVAGDDLSDFPDWSEQLLENGRYLASSITCTDDIAEAQAFFVGVG